MSTRFAKKSKKNNNEWRMKALRFFFYIFAGIIIFRLLSLQVVEAGVYKRLASGQHSFYQELFAERGSVFVRDWRDGKEYIAATNQPKAFIFADPRRILNAEDAAKDIANILGYEITVSETDDDVDGVLNSNNEISGIMEGIEDAEVEKVDSALGTESDAEKVHEGPSDYEILLVRLSKVDDPYEPIKRGVNEATLKKILDLEIDGIDYILEKTRSYPEMNLGGHIFGFVGSDSDGEKIGQYGIEGYLNSFLSGKTGFVDSETDATGRWIGVGSRTFEAAENGGDLLLTIDRTIQYTACKKLREGIERYDAEGGSLVIMEPSTGKIMAICSVPDFDPNIYNEVEGIGIYNNQAIVGAYEPGSVFKPLIMAAALDTGVLTPTTGYEDTGEEEIDQFTIKNSDLKSYGWQTMTQVLEKSLNTGMIYVMRQMDFDTMENYIRKFGFGTISGIELSGEVAGTLASLEQKYEIYYATASYGQGITVTPLQIASAYSAIANGGLLMKPYIVEEYRSANGSVEESRPTVIHQVVSKKTATTVGAMMVSVIENGHGENASVDGYYLAGKTGTAQVAKENGGGYRAEYTKVTFAGFGPVENPRFSMVVMLDHPRAVPWAADTAAPIWGEIADFMLQYLEVAPKRLVN